MQTQLILILIAWIYSGGTLIYALEKSWESKNCFLSKEMENQCATYCYKAMKPLLNIAHQSQSKDAKLADLEKELQELRLQLAVYKETESKNKDLLEMAANIVAIKEYLFSKETSSIQSVDQCKQHSTKTITIRTTKESPNSCMSSDDASNIQMIKVPSMDEFLVPCNSQIAGPGWTVIQQRLNGSVSFIRSWDSYREGFGNLNAEFFIGLEKLHYMLATQRHELYVWMEHMNREIRYAHYDNFMVGDENSGFKLLSLGKHSGNSSNALRRNLDMKFTTYDRDNDMHSSANCAKIFQDAWWHAACSDSNLNGIYNDALHCIYWYQPSLKSNSDCLKTVRMLIRPTDN